MRFLNQSSVILFLLFTLLMSCKKDGPVSWTNGIYRGVFSEINDAGDTWATGIGFLAIHDADSSFTLQGDTLSGVPVSCNGKFSIIDEEFMEFTNKAALGVFDDPYYILDTVFRYAFLDSTLTLRLDIPDRSYDYSLTRF